MLEGQFALLANLLAVVARGFVTVMAVGDEDRLGAHEGDDLRDDVRIVDDPHAVDNAVFIRRFEGRFAAHRVFKDILDFVLRVGIESENLAEVRLARSSEHETVEFRAAHRDFVREDHPFAERRRFAAAHETLAAVFLPADGEDLVIDVQRGLIVSLKNAFRLPVFKGARRAGIAVVRFVVVGIHLVQDEANDVVRVLGVELVLIFRADNVVRGGDDVAQIPNLR